MSTNRLIYLRIFLVLSGLFLIFGIYPLLSYWPSGWRWIPHEANYEQMLMGIYATLGAFLILAAKNPLENLSLIWFTVWSSFVHGGIMLIQAFYHRQFGHLIGDVPALFALGIIFILLTPRKNQISLLSNSNVHTNN